jgi:hypothetical protein
MWDEQDCEMSDGKKCLWARTAKYVMETNGEMRDKNDREMRDALAADSRELLQM